MKRFLIIMLSLLLACSAVFAVEGTDDGTSAATVGTGSVNSGAEDGSKQATALVTLNLSGSGENPANYWEIGFSSEAVNTATSPTTPLKTTSLVLSENDMTAKDDDKVYVYWIIKGGQELKISLSASGALKSTNDSIDWQISWTDKEGTGQTIGTDSAEGSADYSAKNVHTREKGVDGTMTSGDYGSVQLDISTADFSNKKAENYEATLTLTITDVSSN